MKAVLLAAGAGTRLGSITRERPKCLLPVAGRTLLDRQLEALAAAGIDDVTVVAGFEAGQVVEAVAGRCRVLINHDWATTNSIASLLLAAPDLAGHAFLFQNADVIYSPDLMRRFIRAPVANGCLVDPLRPWSAQEYQVTLTDGRITAYSKTLSEAESVGESAQLMKVGAADSAAFFARLREVVATRGAGGFPVEAYPVLMAGEGLWPVYTADLPWFEIDTPEDYARCIDAFTPPPPLPSQRVALGRKLWSFVREPRLPWRWHWLPHVSRTAAHHPLRTLRYLPAFLADELSQDGFDLQVSGPRLLRELLTEARALDLHPVLLWGTLLGCVREGGFIRNDRDIDLGVMAEDAHRLPALRDRMLQRGYQVRLEHDHKLSLRFPGLRTLFLELDVVRPFKGGWAITNADEHPHRRFHYRFGAEVFGATRPARLAGSDVLLPADPEGFLEAVYGEWRVPEAKAHWLYGPPNLEIEVIPR